MTKSKTNRSKCNKCKKYIYGGNPNFDVVSGPITISGMTTNNYGGYKFMLLGDKHVKYSDCDEDDKIITIEKYIDYITNDNQKQFDVFLELGHFKDPSEYKEYDEFYIFDIHNHFKNKQKNNVRVHYSDFRHIYDEIIVEKNDIKLFRNFSHRYNNKHRILTSTNKKIPTKELLSELDNILPIIKKWTFENIISSRKIKKQWDNIDNKLSINLKKILKPLYNEEHKLILEWMYEVQKTKNINVKIKHTEWISNKIKNYSRLEFLDEDDYDEEFRKEELERIDTNIETHENLDFYFTWIFDLYLIGRLFRSYNNKDHARISIIMAGVFHILKYIHVLEKLKFTHMFKTKCASTNDDYFSSGDEFIFNDICSINDDMRFQCIELKGIPDPFFE